MKISIGEVNGKAVAFDLDTLLVTRLLIQANSGAGKSWLLRKLIEQLYGHVQVLVIDPEGEFATLRKKFDFVLVGPGGETAADVRSAELLAQKLLELRASAVCDLYEMKPSDRHVWVKKFLDAMINAPKKLWHPCVVIVDEAQLFCPQDGESVAEEAMVSLTTRGRKRGFCAVWATQRLAKVNKDATSMLLNRLVGGTFEDVDIKRALDLLSVPPEEKRAVSQQLKTMDPGWFFAFGRAISKERLLFKVGQVETPHPQAGSAKHAATPPPPPEKIRELLPALADLPHVAEEQERSIAELQREIRTLKSQLAAKEREKTTPTVDEQAIVSAVQIAVKKRDEAWMASVAEKADSARTYLTSAIDLIEKLLQVRFDAPLPTHIASMQMAATPAPAGWEKKQSGKGVAFRRLALQSPANSNGDLSPAQSKILDRLRELVECTRRDRVPKEQLAAWAQYSPTGGGFANYLGSLRTAGYIDYPDPGYVALTDKGIEHSRAEHLPHDPVEMLERAQQVLGGSEGRILEAVFRVWPEQISKAELAERTGFAPTGGGYANYLGHMRTLGFIDYPQQGYVRAADWLFLEGAN